MRIAWGEIGSRIGLRVDSGVRSAGEIAFGRLAIVVLAIEWVVFGSMHFSLPDDTARQLPEWAPFKPAVVAISGMTEVAIGLLMLAARTRRAAASASLVLLAIYLLPVVQILSDPTALAGMSPDASRAFRLILVPNNLFLAICSVFVVEHPGLTLLGPAGARTPAVLPAAGHDLPTLFVACLFLACNCAGFLAMWLGVRGHAPEALLWAMAFLAIGALLGFLFGVPKLNRSAAIGDHLMPNTNVEEVSDWLTKIVVGVGLVNFSTIAVQLGRYADRIANSLQVTHTFAAAMMAYFATLGLIEGYILTRLFLARQFARGIRRAAVTRPPRAL